MKFQVLLLRRISIVSLLLLFSLISFAQTFPVTGKVTSATGEPLAGVTVQVKNSQASAVSTNDGSFSINAPSSNSVLVFSYVGYSEQQVPVNGKPQLSVSLMPSNTSLENVGCNWLWNTKEKECNGSCIIF